MLKNRCSIAIYELFRNKSIESKIDGKIGVQLYEHVVTNAYEVVEGPSEIDEFIKNLNVESGWKTTYIWKVKPNGDWTNGNAPINLFVEFNQAYDDERKIDFTIANPHILDEKYSGFNIIPTTDPSSTNQPPSQGSPGFGGASAMLGILLAVVYRARRA